MMGSMFVASNVNECRDSNPITMDHLTLYGLLNIDVRSFETTLLNTIDWNVHPITSYQLTMNMLDLHDSESE